MSLVGKNLGEFSDGDFGCFFETGKERIAEDKDIHDISLNLFFYKVCHIESTQLLILIIFLLNVIFNHSFVGGTSMLEIEVLLIYILLWV